MIIAGAPFALICGIAAVCRNARDPLALTALVIASLEVLAFGTLIMAMIVAG